MNYTDEQKAVLLGLIAAWQKRLRLLHWVVRVDWDAPAVNEDCGLEVEVVEGRHYAVVRIGGFFEQPEEERENAVCHELLHCVLGDLTHTLLALTERMGREAAEYARGEVLSALEYAVDHLANVLAPIEGRETV